MIRIEEPRGEQELKSFLAFHDEVYRQRAASRLEFVPLRLPLLLGQTPFTVDRKLRPLIAHENGKILARAVAVVDGRYHQLWKERLGHIVMFEAMPEAQQASRALLDAACEWLASEGMEAARLGFGMLDLPLVIDDYEALLPPGSRQNPAYYHRFLKGAYFGIEKSWLDYRIEVTPERIAQMEAAKRGGAGFDIAPLADVPVERRMRHFTEIFNETFSQHWAYTPYREEELTWLFQILAPLGVLQASMLAYRGEEPVAFSYFIAGGGSGGIRVDPGRILADTENLNFYQGVGVRASARGGGLGLAVSAHTLLEGIRRGAKHLLYNLVMDDNLPSRRIPERLGGVVSTNYVVYRRELSGPKR